MSASRRRGAAELGTHGLQRLARAAILESSYGVVAEHALFGELDHRQIDPATAFDSRWIHASGP